MAPFLSDLLLANLDRALEARLREFSVVRTLRYVNGYLFLRSDPQVFRPEVAQVLETFCEDLRTLVVTHELPDKDNIRFLDLRTFFFEDHTFWCYEHSAQKPILPFTIAHSKLVKRAIVQACFSNPLQRSCHHALLASLLDQSERLEKARVLRSFIQLIS